MDYLSSKYSILSQCYEIIPYEIWSFSVGNNRIDFYCILRLLEVYLELAHYTKTIKRMKYIFWESH